MDRSRARSFLVAVALVASACGPTTSPGSDAGSDAGTCARDEECSDGLFCTGAERCAPGAAGSDARGCAPADAAACAAGVSCDEAMDRCTAACPDADGDGHASDACGGDDCDDADPARHSGALEICDGDDEDCDDTTIGERDADGDTFTSAACCNGAGPDARCGEDCDDTERGVNPDVPDPCDGRDNDCDGATDEGGLLHRDVDNDGRGDPATSMTGACMVGWVFNDEDCDDTSQITYVGARERCDGRDNDCSLAGALAGGVDATEDVDGDGHARVGATCLSPSELGADALGNEYPENDCNDADATIYGGAAEICANGIDENCNGTPDDPERDVYRDADGDGHGTSTMSMRIMTCALPAGWSDSSDDCADGDATRFPGNPEICDRVDNDCSTPSTAAAVDEDVDGDDYAPSAASCLGRGDALAPPSAFPRSDCADDRAAVHPDVIEHCDGEDRDCSSGGTTAMDEDADGDGHSPIAAACIGLGEVGGVGTDYPKDDCADAVPTIHGGRTELDDVMSCDGLDNDCDPLTIEIGVACATGGYCNAGGVCGRRARVIQLGGGAEHTCALVSDGTVRCWGYNVSGQLGTGLAGAGEPTPAVVSGLRGVVQLSVGYDHNCARLGDGTVRCWGGNLGGQLGDGTTTNRASPIAITALAGVAEIGAGLGHTCARLGDGSVRCWGNNAYGQLGDGTMTNRAMPALVPGLTGVVDLDTGHYHTCAVASGGVQCWGYNSSGQLGDGTTTNRTMPTMVPGLTSTWVPSAGMNHTCARLMDGSVRCWGAGDQGQLGDGTTSARLVPTIVPSLTGLTEVDVGSAFSCAVLADTTAQCWGANSYGQLGDGTTSGQLSPTAVVGLDGIVTLGVGHVHVCAALRDGSVRCWGRNAQGGLGDGTTTSRSIPTTVIGFGAAAELAAGGHTCARLGDGSVRCWGRNNSGQLGDGTTTSRSRATTVPGLAGVAQVVAGTGHTCARLADGTVRCWGENELGQLGDGTTTDRSSPTIVPGLASVVQLAAGAVSAHTCALSSDGTVRCWGNATSGQVGDGTDFTIRQSPTVVTGLGGVVEIVAGGTHTCARLGDGTVRCWGRNAEGELGDGTSVQRPSATVVPGLTGVVALGAGLYHSCAVLGDGTARCWGDNTFGQVGDGTMVNRFSPTVIPGASVVEIRAGEFHTCARLADASVTCWGRNDGQLGDGTTTARPTPTAVPGLSSVVEIRPGRSHTCARRRDGSVWCWGDNAAGQLGDWTLDRRLTPALAWDL